MEWNMPECNYCKNRIDTPRDAVYLSFSVKGDSFAHIDCFVKVMVGHAGDVEGASGYVPSPMAVLSMRNTAGDIKRDMESGDRKTIQNRVNFNYGIGGGIIMAALGAMAAYGAFRNSDAIVLAAGAALLFIGLAVFAANVVATLHRAEFEKLVAKQR